ncbi:MAG: YaeQ family protein [Myxococcales bacterium]|nr:YaeQ family protein [Myxococcales bacterium]
MALPSTIYRVRLELSDVDRGVYDALDLRMAQHPSETAAFFLTRLLAFALEQREHLAFGKGISDADEPAIWARDYTEKVLLWLDVGRARRSASTRRASWPTRWSSTRTATSTAWSTS